VGAAFFVSLFAIAAVANMLKPPRH
jgi:hypothetical protein